MRNGNGNGERRFNIFFTITVVLVLITWAFVAFVAYKTLTHFHIL